MSVVIETTLGDITVDLYLEQRPVTCLNFLKLCKMKYYNFNLFHSIRSGFIAQTGDPTAEGSGGESIFGRLEGPEKRFFMGEKLPKIRHTNTGTLSMVCTGDMMVGSQFFFTLAPDLDSLDGVHCVIGEVTEGHDVLRMLNDVICDDGHRPYRDVRITHTVILEDPFNDPTGFRAPSRSPSPSAERLKGGRIAPDEDIDETQGKTAEEVQEQIEEKEAKARATILEIVGDLPDAEIAPPENVLFVCKLNPVTTDEDLEIIFSRFGKIVGCEVIRDKKTGDSLQYAFVEFADKKSCEDAYFKMDNVLIDDRRIHVDFSQSVSRMRWFGKGRGIKYFNNNDAKDKTLTNHSSQHHNQNGEDHKNGKIDDNKSRHRSKDRDHHRNDKDSKYDRSSRHRSERDRSRRSRSRSRKEKSSRRSKRDNSRSVSKDRHRKRRSRTKSRDRSKRKSSRSRDSSRRDRDRRRSRQRSNRDRSRSRHKSKRDRSRSRHRSRKDRSRSRHRRDKSKSRHDQNKSSTRQTSHEKKYDKEIRIEPKDTSPNKQKEKSNSKENQSKLDAQDFNEQENTNKSEKTKSRSASPKNEKEIEIIQKYFLVKKSRWVEVTETGNEEHEKESGIASCENNNEEILTTADVSLDKHESTINKTSDITEKLMRNDNVDGIIEKEINTVNEESVESEKVDNVKQAHVIGEETKPQQEVSKKSVEKDTRTPTPVIKKKDIKHKISSKNDKKKIDTKVKTKKKRKQSTTSESSSESSSSSDSSSSSEDIKKKKKSLKKRKKKVSTSSSSSSSESSSSSSDSSSTSSSDSEPVKKKRKKKASKVIKAKKAKKKS